MQLTALHSPALSSLGGKRGVNHEKITMILIRLFSFKAVAAS
jgi:hypothetical protein